MAKFAPNMGMIHMPTRRPAQDTTLQMDFLYGFLQKGIKSVWIDGILWLNGKTKLFLRESLNGGSQMGA